MIHHTDASLHAFIARWHASGASTRRPLTVKVAAAPMDRVAELLETLVTLGQARQTAEGRFVG